MIYSKDGTSLNSAYSLDGTTLTEAFDIDGNEIWTTLPTTVKVMTYNCGGWYIGSGTNVPSDKYTAYYNLQNGMIGDNNPDILILQEYWQVFSTGHSALDMLKSYFPYVETRLGTDQWYGHAICSKYPISNYTQRLYANESKRYYDSCTITINGKEVTVLTTHLDPHDQTKRSSEIAELVPFLSQLTRFIIGGDFNTKIVDSNSTEMIAANVTPFINAGFNTANFGDFGFLQTYSEEPDTNVVLCIDNIYASSNISIDSVMVDTTKETDSIVEFIDHMPLIATVQI